jgi:hypothetical protein
MEDLQTSFGDGKSLKPAPIDDRRRGHDGLTLPLSGDLFDPPAEAVVDNSLICAAVHESAFGTKRTSRPAQPMSAFGGHRDLGNFFQAEEGTAPV